MEDAQVIAALVRRCVAGDAAAWEEIVQRFNRRIYNICYRFAGSSDDAQDLTQEVFIKMYRTLDSFDPERASFNTWITTVTRNLLVDHFRKTKYDRATDSIDSARGDGEDGQTLSEQLADKGPGPDERLNRMETKRWCTSSPEAFAGITRGGNPSRSAGYGLSGDRRGAKGSRRNSEVKDKSRSYGTSADFLQRTYRQVS